MKKVAKFEKISLSQFNDCLPMFENFNYTSIKLPFRATLGSAGYDFFLPYDIIIKPKQNILIPTGVRCKIKDGYVLQLYPRSGLGFKYGLQLINTVGIIDSDYYYAANEGHIMAKLVNTGDKEIYLEEGTAFMQGIFTEFFVTEDDFTEGVRVGGFGSTSRTETANFSAKGS